VLAGLAELAGSAGALGDCEVVHGSTVALNALLTGRVARAAWVTNEGFRDLIEIGRQARPDIYALHPEKPAPLVPRERRFTVEQRSVPRRSAGHGPVTAREEQRPGAEDLERLARRLVRCGAESIAVGLLHSYADTRPEQRIARALRGLGVPVTCSATVLPAHREYERFSTAIVNAAVAPIMQRYLAQLGSALGDRRLSILQSSGGTLAAEQAAREPVRVLLSGPAGGVVGAGRAAAQSGLGSVATLDMGGTSTDVAFHAPHAGAERVVHDTEVAGHPVAVPSLDIHTIGCGGGSMVRVDAGGVLKVGPESAGADPGPLCYGAGELPTVTDAHVFLGHVATGGFLGGKLELDVDAVARAFERLARELGTRPHHAAAGVLEVARAAMRRALSVMTMQRGSDPRGIPLVAFGGAGGLSGAALAGSLEMPGALIPALPGVLSAWGMATAEALRDHGSTVLAPLATWSRRDRKAVLTELARTGKEELRAEGFRASSIEHELICDLRYRGQSFELSVPEGGKLRADFDRRHAARYGWSLEDAEVELVQLRARSVVRAAELPRPRTRRRPAPRAAVIGTRRAWFDGHVEAQLIDRAALAPGHTLSGPAIVEEYSGTTLVPPGWTAEVKPGGHLFLTHTR